MVGSTQSTSGPMFVLNTIVAEVLSNIADELEKAKNVKAAAQKILQDIATKHRKIIFNGDNYTDEKPNYMHGLRYYLRPTVCLSTSRL